MTLNLRKLTSICTQLAYQGCQIIKTSITDPNCHQYMKGPIDNDDSVTDADYKVQSMILEGIRRHYPYLQIVCQESQQYKGQIDFNFQSLREDILPNQSQIHRQLNIKQACLWIDPIDCTKGFINGNFEDVTVLIGLSYQKSPVMGIIATPFKLVGSNKLFDPVVTVGSVQERETYDFFNLKWLKKHKSIPHNPLIICSSNTRSNQTQQNFLQTIGGRNLKVGGAGRKIMMVANSQADAMIFLDSWTHLWDSCAGEAIIKSMGGYFSTPFGTKIVYDHTISSTHNKQGILTALDKQVYEKSIQVMGLV